MPASPAQIRQQISERIVEALLQGTPPWRKPWASQDLVAVPNQAVYLRPPVDTIHCPCKEMFANQADRISTVAHELVHWTEDKVGWSGSYAEGELIAEIGACFFMSSLGVPNSDDMTNHHAYLASWLQAMNNDHRCIFRAASQASKAVDFILSFSRESASESGPCDPSEQRDSLPA